MSKVVSVLLVLWCFCRVSELIDVYVLASYPDPPLCPCPTPQANETIYCQTLAFYGNNTGLLEQSANVTAHVLCGVHSSIDSQRTPISIGNLSSLTVQPAKQNQQNNVSFDDFTFKVENVKFFRMEDITILNVNLQVYPLSEHDHQSVLHIINCSFISLPDNILVSVDLTLEDSSFRNCSSSALNLFHSSIHLKGTVLFFNNSGVNGGALSLTSSQLIIENGAEVQFTNNNATAHGGAIYIDDASLFVYEAYKYYNCFYTLMNYDNTSTYRVVFSGNSAQLGGEHIYGASLKSYCTATITKPPTYSCQILHSSPDVFKFDNPSLEGLSPISGQPMRVCLCNKLGIPECINVSNIVPLQALEYIPGEKASFSVSLVGGDFGWTTGTLYISRPGQNAKSSIDIDKTNCSTVDYTIVQQSKDNQNEVLCLSTARSAQRLCKREGLQNYNSHMQNLIEHYHQWNVIDPYLLDTPILLNISYHQCPPGFYLEGPPYRCVCHSALKVADQLNDGGCLIENGTGYITRTSRWFNASHTKVITSEMCPSEYCRDDTEAGYINLNNSHDAHCAHNHTGILCGGCIDNNSVALGSTHCIYCPNKNNLGLIVFFAAAGLLLVFFISILNLTITQGLVNSIIFYANIVWAHESIFFPSSSHTVLLVFRTFIAWLNLDFGIQLCFFRGLDAYGKTWLQYAFPVYISIIAGLMIVGAKLSKKLTTLVGNKAVPLIDTLLLLSYVKLLRTIVDSLAFSELKTYVGNSTEGEVTWVWHYDGRLPYLTSKHAGLFFVALVALVFLWLPYTLLLLLVQILRRLSGYTLFRWVSRLYPVYDTHLAPLKAKHQYWFGVLLLVRGVVYITGLIPFYNVTLFTTAIIITLVLFYTLLVRPYKDKKVFLLESLSFFNLSILTITTFFIKVESSNAKALKVIVGITCSVVLLQFGGLIWMSVFSTCICKCGIQHKLQGLYESSFIPRRKVRYDKYRDSILSETTSLQGHTE